MLTTTLLDSAATAGELLRTGKLVAFPTETVYGLGVDATSSQAVARLFEAKGRPSDNPLIVHLHSAAAWHQAAREMTPSADQFLQAFAPGPLTVVLPRGNSIASDVCAGLDTVGIRIPKCQLAREVLRVADRPIAAPSANRSGTPSCTTWQAVVEDLDGRIDAVLMGQVSAVGLESTVVDCCGEVPVLLRTGAITLEQLQSVVPSTRGLQHDSDEDRRRKSPGLNHPHYQPRAQVQLFANEDQLQQLLDHADGAVAVGRVVVGKDAELHAIGPNATSDLSRRSSVILSQEFSSVEAYAQGFYEFLRQADRRSAAVVFLQLAPATGIGVALRDRQLRAAGTKNH